MNISIAFLLFLSGVLSYMLGIRIFKIWSKAAMYKITYINCLAVLQLADSMSQDILRSTDPENQDNVEAVFDFWREMALHSLNTTIPDKVWKEISVSNWDSAMKILEKIEKGIKS
tara:strand:+ start:5205 stop:5549 length:345 start_codon:yes stop_codon:yes gene_type:complete